MYTISKEFHVCCSHQLEGLPPGHPCSRHHGHNYIITVELEANELDEVGFVVDYGVVTKSFGAYLDDNLDHRHLNDVVGFNPTAERLAAWLYGVARDIFELPVARIGVSETPKTQAWYSPWEHEVAESDYRGAVRVEDR